MRDPLRSIEFVGAPGSGKTTVVDWLAGRSLRSGGSKRWLVPAASLPHLDRDGTSGSGGNVTPPWVRAAVARRPWLGRIARTSPADRPPETPEWAEHVLSVVRGATVLGPRGATSYREEALGWLQTTVGLVEAARGASRRLIPMIAEGIVQRSLSVLGPRPEEATLRAMLALIPRSSAVVHLTVPDDVLIGRALTRARSGTAPLLHQGLTDREIAALVVEDAAELSRRTEILEAEGRQVLWIDTSEDGRAPSVGALGRAVLGALVDRSPGPQAEGS